MQEKIEKIWESFFAAKAPITLDQYKELNFAVNNSESNQIAFIEQVDALAASRKKDAAEKAGVGYSVAHRYDAALRSLESCGSGIALYCKAKALFALGRKAEALEEFRKAVEKSENPAAVELERIQAMLKAGLIEQAGSQLNNLAKALKGKSADFHCVYARYCEYIGEYESATENYEAALTIDNDHVDSLFGFANLLDLYGNVEAAIDLYLRVTKANPINVNALMNLALLYEDTGNFDNALSCVNLVLKYYPNDKRAILFRKDIMGATASEDPIEPGEQISVKTKLFDKPITDYELSVRSKNCLKKMNIATIGDLLTINEQELLAYKNFGETSLHEIRDILESEGLELGMYEGVVFESESNDEYDPHKELLKKPISELELSVRAGRAVDRLNIRTLGELVAKSEQELLGCKNFGSTSLTEIKEKLDKYGLSLKKQD
ncbi:MAG: DNA-directed RNA polymerase subunit alpha C-terminal domain-containing protein [Phycisphaerae bacterium]|jgi:DNA-directed RNA polymerase subunit alpha